MERIQKLIAQSGYTSRRKAEQLMLDGKVKVNGVIVTELGTKASPSDDIIVEGNSITKEEHVYYVLYKPEHVISTTDDQFDRKTVVDLIDSNERIYPVGRLDYDTSGVLLLTNDGTFTNELTHPRYHIEKEYLVKVEGFVRKNESRKLCRGIMLDGVKTKKAWINNVTYNKKSETTSLHLTITEGKYHQVKRMFEIIDHPVVSLKRVRYGSVTVEGMKTGEYRMLKPYELKQLRHQITMAKQKNKNNRKKVYKK